MFLACRPKNLLACGIFSIIRHMSETHYDTLNLKRTCTTQDIKNSFVRLSKEYHPDKTTNKASHAHFIKILEAYNVLSKPQRRKLYDLGLNDTRQYGRGTKEKPFHFYAGDYGATKQ